MTFNKTKIEWCDVTWNPVTGCLQGCSFCYARGIANRFKNNYGENFTPRFYPERLKDPVREKKPKVIFVVSMGDLFGNDVPKEWIDKVLLSCIQALQHTYIFLTKNPDRMIEIFEGRDVVNNCWLGTSCGESRESWNRPMRRAPLVAMGWNTFLSVEPFKVPNRYNGIPHIKWFIVGTQTNPPSPPTYATMIEFMKYRPMGVPIFMKESIKKDFPSMELLREFPVSFTKIPHGVTG